MSDPTRRLWGINIMCTTLGEDKGYENAVMRWQKQRYRTDLLYQACKDETAGPVARSMKLSSAYRDGCEHWYAALRLLTEAMRRAGMNGLLLELKILRINPPRLLTSSPG
jgi:hypothetical protein